MLIGSSVLLDITNMEIYLSIVAVICLIAEIATLITIGPPWLTLPGEYVRDQIEAAKLNSLDAKILSTPNGYVSTCGVGITGSLYYGDINRTGLKTRIPWWSPLYKTVRTKRASLLMSNTKLRHRRPAMSSNQRLMKTKRNVQRRLSPAPCSAALPRIFSGDASRKMWAEINGAKNIDDLRMALYVVCCRLQELEEKVERKKRA